MGKRQRIEELELALKQLRAELGKAKRETARHESRRLELRSELDRISDALRQALEATRENGGWAAIAERQRIYIKALEERLAGTWNPADTHQQEYDAMYAARRARN
jgi:chromosome segregation ATPase